MSLRSVLPICAVLGLSGCAFEGEDASRSAEKGGSHQAEDLGSLTQAATLAASDEFESFTYKSANGNAATERFAECGQDEVLTGFGARARFGDVRDVTVYCRDILPDGTLNGEEDSYFNGTTAQEKVIHANPGSVLVGLGGWVATGSDFGRLTAKQCVWDPQTRTIKVETCNWITSDTSLDVELKLDIQSTYSNSEKPSIVGLGAGMSASGSDMSEIRMKVGKLRNNTVFQESPITGGERYYTVTVPNTAYSAHIRTSMVGQSQIGDADLFVRKNSPVSHALFDCASRSYTNIESCDFIGNAGGTYYILVDPWAPYQEVRLTVSYSTTQPPTN